jgi:hypothetical protein
MPEAPLTDLFPRITSFAALHAAALRAQKGKRYRPAVLAFNAQLEANLFQLQHELQSFTYAPGPYRQFEIRDPKRRLISAAPYRDRVVHHAFCAAIVPPLQKRFITTSYANRIGFGSHKALWRFVAECGRHRWVFSGDIRLYFPSIDLTILRQQLAERIACPGTLWLLDRSLANGASHGPALEGFPGDTLLTPLERPRQPAPRCPRPPPRRPARHWRLLALNRFPRLLPPPAPFNVRARGWESSGSTGGVQTRS